MDTHDESNSDHPGDGGRTARARILDSALAEFTEHGVAPTSLKAVATAAGVSSQLIIHHFRSKEGLVTACDEYIMDLFHSHNTTLLSSVSKFSPGETLEKSWLGTAMGYLSVRLTDDSPTVNQLVDDAFADSLDYLERGEDSGLIKRTGHPRERAAVILIWNLGALALHRHVRRLTGIDLARSSAKDRTDWSLMSTEILTNGLFNVPALERLRADTADAAGAEPALRPEDTPDDSAV